MVHTHPLSIRLEISSAFDMLDMLQAISDHACRLVGLDEDSMHWVSMAVRESVANAIKHGNQNDATKRVFIAFDSVDHGQAGLAIRVRDEGAGFDPETVADPLAPENLLKGSGRGIFLIRSFMDEMVLQRAPEGGMEMRMVKRVQATAPDAP
ncbi:MAG: ATP-binding protein [Acidobacteria bacterium]|nr:ATP-binding protein [Acidobacteriota bacterium]